MNRIVKPFVKWAGGKTQLLDLIRNKYPDNIERYCEPFVGGGAVLLDVLVNFHPKEVLINDINFELINTYTQIRDNVEGVISQLSNMQDIFWNMDNEDRKLYYYSRREKFNELIDRSEYLEEKASLFIFINKTCFNGLYRVNGKGLYNVPMGSYKKPLICDSTNLRFISELLQGIKIRCGDYRICEPFIDDKTLVYIDPPYRPLSVTSSFTSYTKIEFGDEQQIQLGNFASRMSRLGAKIIASNSDPKNIDANDNFFDELYDSFSIDRVVATRMINSKAIGRGPISELLISN